MLLAIDTSGPFCSAALHDGTSLIVQQSDDIGRGHAEHLMPMLEGMMSTAGMGWQTLSRICCTVGPGSFTGLRVGLATARGLALALDCPCIGVTAFDGFAYGQKQPLAVVLDAKRDEIWMQIFDSDNTPPLAAGLEEAGAVIPDHVSTLIGSGSPLLIEQDPRFNCLSEMASPPIASIAELGIKAEKTSAKPKPLYLRSPDAKPQTPRQVAV